MPGDEVRGRHELEPSRLVEPKGQCDSAEPRERSQPPEPSPFSGDDSVSRSPDPVSAAPVPVVLEALAAFTFLSRPDLSFLMLVTWGT